MLVAASSCAAPAILIASATDLSGEESGMGDETVANGARPQR